MNTSSRVQTNRREMATFRLQVPHIVKNFEEVRQNIQVKFQRWKNDPLQRAHPFRENRPLTSVLYKLYKCELELLSCHFSNIFITAKGIKCCCHSAGLLVFSKLVKQPNPLANLRVYFTSFHYDIKDYLQVRMLFSYVTVAQKEM